MRKYINIQLEPDTIKNLDIIADNEKRKRKQIIELIIENSVHKKVKDGDLTLGD